MINSTEDIGGRGLTRNLTSKHPHKVQGAHKSINILGLKRDTLQITDMENYQRSLLSLGVECSLCNASKNDLPVQTLTGCTVSEEGLGPRN